MEQQDAVAQMVVQDGVAGLTDRAPMASMTITVGGLVPHCFHCERELIGGGKLIITPAYSEPEESGGVIFDRRAVLLLCPFCDGEVARIEGRLHYVKK